MNYTHIDNDIISGQCAKIRVQISVVSFYINDDIFTLMDSIVKAERACPNIQVDVTVVENGFKQKTDLHHFLEEQYPCCRVVISGENIGYGRAHNLTLSHDYDYHLILNPDIILYEDTLAVAMRFMNDNPQCGLLTPLARWRNGERQFLCKRYPSVFTLLLRAFAPAIVKKFLSSDSTTIIWWTLLMRQITTGILKLSVVVLCYSVVMFCSNSQDLTLSFSCILKIQTSVFEPAALRMLLMCLA